MGKWVIEENGALKPGLKTASFQVLNYLNF